MRENEKEAETEAELNPRHMVLRVALIPVASYGAPLVQNLESVATHILYGGPKPDANWSRRFHFLDTVTTRLSA